MYRRGKVDGEYQDGEVRGLVFVAGKRSMGKTTELARMVSCCSGGVVFFDTLSVHHEVLKGWVLVTEPGELKDYLRDHYKGKFRALYQPRAGELDAHFAAVCRIALAFGSMVLGVDELDKLCGTRFGESRMPGPLYDIANYGRHHSLAAIATARRPAQVPRGYSGGCFEMRIFRITEQIDLKYFSDLLGGSVQIGRANVPTAERLASLDKYQYILWRDGEDAVRLAGGRR